MNWKTFIIVLLAGTSIVFSTLYFTRKPKTIVVTVSDPEIISKPDTVYIKKIKLVPVPGLTVHDTTYIAVEDSTAPGMTVSEETFEQETALGVIGSKVIVYSGNSLYAIGDSLYLPDGGVAAMERIKKEVLAANKPSKFWRGFFIGSGVISSIVIAGVLIN